MFITDINACPTQLPLISSLYESLWLQAFSGILYGKFTKKILLVG